MVICKVLKFGKLCVNISKRKDKSVRAWEWFCHKGKNCFSHIYLQLLESITWKTRNSLENLGAKLLWLVILISDIGCFVHFIQEIQIPFYCLLKNRSTLAELSNATSWMGIVLEKTFSQRIWKNLGFSEESVLLLSMLRSDTDPLTHCPGTGHLFQRILFSLWYVLHKAIAKCLLPHKTSRKNSVHTNKCNKL